MKHRTFTAALIVSATLAATLAPLPVAAFEIGGLTPVLTFPEGDVSPTPDTTTRGATTLND
ncbi:hypothetical protein D6850_11965 [Roseovarius spongiae]|uniref:Uncharacterized protein n=1 Tax=Roseovarius spongiae TaxID=2320272 RepID=A0A3A8ATB3_9RHOB|nr:hypothetical protein [Roseovarius spongiae]RKF13901.1 hypothetical protein D6850_11965 [Roseovarius spongiae]